MEMQPPDRAALRALYDAAVAEIDMSRDSGLADKAATGEERASRKRRLIAGPKEFRGLRQK